MDLLDGIVLIVLAISTLHGLRVGAVAQIVSLIGILAGLVLGVVLVLHIDSHLNGTLTKSLVAIVLLIAPASVLAGFARRFGISLSTLVRRVHLGLPDRLIGAVVAIAGSLVICWLFASILINSSSSAISSQIERSKILQEVEQVMPPVPDAFSAVERYLTSSGFPQVLVNALPESLAPITDPSTRQLASISDGAHSSTVKIVAIGCGLEDEGSGFVSNKDLVITNAHVVAGAHNVSVLTTSGAALRATVILFDKNFDLAVLRVPGLSAPELKIDPGFVERGIPAVVLGYPEGGPLNAQPAGVVSRFVAQGRDIYDASLTSRVVYELHADVRPGNSGGPLLGTDGQVIGVVFSRSAATPNIGYALSSPGVAQRLAIASHNDQAVSTQSCVN